MMKKCIGTIEDGDFGDVDVFYYPEKQAIVAGGLCIKEVPENYTSQDIIEAWTMYKNHYCEYGTIWILYEQIAQGESLFN